MTQINFKNIKIWSNFIKKILKIRLNSLKSYLNLKKPLKSNLEVEIFKYHQNFSKKDLNCNSKIKN